VRVERIAVTAVKGLALVHEREVFLDVEGVAGNRRFYLVDDGGRLFTARHHGPLMRIRPRYDAERDHLRLEFPDGHVVEQRVELGGPVATAFWQEREVRGRLVLGPFGDAFSTYAGRRLRLVKTERAGTGNDLHAATIVSQASVDELGRRAGSNADPDVRRFRMLFTIAGCDAHEEDRWIGERLRIGDAIVRVAGPVPRCVMTTYNPDTGRRDLDTLRIIKSYRGVGGDGKVEFGVYAVVEQAGRVQTGDAVALAGLEGGRR
jgi:uncharacterized protein